MTLRDLLILNAAGTALGSILWGGNLTPETAKDWLGSMGIHEHELAHSLDSLVEVTRSLTDSVNLPNTLPEGTTHG